MYFIKIYFAKIIARDGWAESVRFRMDRPRSGPHNIHRRLAHLLLYPQSNQNAFDLNPTEAGKH